MKNFEGDERRKQASLTKAMINVPDNFHHLSHVVWASATRPRDNRANGFCVQPLKPPLLPMFWCKIIKPNILMENLTTIKISTGKEPPEKLDGSEENIGKSRSLILAQCPCSPAFAKLQTLPSLNELRIR